MHYFSSMEDHVAVTSEAGGWHIIGQNRVVGSIHGSDRHEWFLTTDMTVQRINGDLKIMEAVVTTY